MEQLVKKRLYENSLNFKMSLDRIIDKYSRLQHQDGGLEVNLSNLKSSTLGHYINLSKKTLDILQSKSPTDLSELSLNAQDITGDSQLDVTHQEDGEDESCDSIIQFVVDNHNGTVGSLEASLKSFSEGELQPEDQDEDLQMSLSSNGSSLVELYPSMVSRIGRAWHRQHVSAAADSVLRRYRRWRQQSKRSNLNGTFDVSLRHANCNPIEMSSRSLLRDRSSSPVKRQLVRAETTPRSAGKERGLLRRERPHPVRVMNFSEIFEPKEISLNETFTVGQLSPPKLPQLGERASIYTAWLSQPRHAAAEASEDPPFRLKRFPEPSHRSGRSTCATESPAVRERPGIYSSPLRQSPFKAIVRTTLSRSPHAFSRSPKEYSMVSCSREPMRPRSLSTSLSSPPRRPVVQLRMLYPQDSHQSLQPQSRSPLSARTADGHHRLRRHLSFDSLLPPRSTSYSPKKIDEDFMKLYHKFACQNKSASFNGPPCRLCARSSKATGGHSSSALAALALSPHRSVLRKRHRELGWNDHPQSKYSREEYCTYSPGSKSHRRELPRDCLSPSELPHLGLSYSPSQRRTQRPLAHQEAWMSRHRPGSAADFSGL
ncbi:uncharacterized protein PAE49_016301 [Odontesthes bonariensis]|uniref:uncharacterized protein LOC142400076 n=1 Tax=Odontesthes bonariensis TaxID=219752 RepID=UPI003F58165D